MKYLSSAVSLLVIAWAFLTQATIASAQTVPSFPACSNPQGEIKASYDSGTHGIVGNTSEYAGSDQVYRLSNDSLVQCYCAENGSGIQTNWWKVDTLSASTIDSLRRDGWLYIPNGALWGLDSAPYLTKNSDYSCTGRGGILGTADAFFGSKVLGLASTGNMLTILGLGALGIASIAIGLKIRPKSK